MLQDDSPVKRKRCFVNSIPLLQVTWRWYTRPLPLSTKGLFSLFTPQVVFLSSIWGRCIPGWFG